VLFQTLRNWLSCELVPDEVHGSSDDDQSLTKSTVKYVLS